MDNMDFTGFTYNGKHSLRDLGIYRTSDGSRYNENLTATMTDKIVDVPGGDGQYYFGTTFKNRTFTVNYAFDNLSESHIRELKNVFCGDGIHDLIFDETPYKAWSAKVTGTASIKHLCFIDENDKRVYKGEGSITFTCYYPYARTPDKLWVDRLDENGEEIIEYLTRDGRLLSAYSDTYYTNKSEWAEASGLENNLNTIKGDVPTPFILTIDFRETGTLNSVSINSVIVNNQSITFNTPITVQENDVFTWNSKTGLFKKGNIIYPYIGQGIQNLKPGEEISIDITGNNLPMINGVPKYKTNMSYNYLYR